MANAVRRLHTLASTPAEIRARARALDLLALQPGHRVIDVGAGTGVLALEIARRAGPGTPVTALDSSWRLLELAAQTAKETGLAERVDTLTGDARALPFPDDAFDRAICHWLLLHVAPAERVLHEMRRVVRPGGRVVCVEVDWETAIVHPGERRLTRRILQASADRHVDGWMGRRLSSLMLDAGLERVRIEPIVDVDDGTGNAGWLDFLSSRARYAFESAVVTEQEATHWYQAIQSAAEAGRYFFSLTQFAVVGEVPDRSTRPGNV